jgi:hypothetical protein
MPAELAPTAAADRLERPTQAAGVLRPVLRIEARQHIAGAARVGFFKRIL